MTWENDDRILNFLIVFFIYFFIIIILGELTLWISVFYVKISLFNVG